MATIKFSGVDGHYGKCRIRYMYRRVREHLHTDLPYNPANAKNAAQVLRQIKAEIATGTYDERKYFPDRATGTGELFRDLANEWLQNVEGAGNKKATCVKYKQLLDDIWLPIFGDMHMRRLTTSEVRKLVNTAREWGSLSPGRWNDALIPLRAVISLGVEKELCNRELISWAKNKKRRLPRPQALSVEERKTLLAWTEANLPAQAHNAIEFLLVTGLRPGELIALQWDDVQFDDGLMVVRRTKNLGKLDLPKSGKERVVTLSTKALDCLRRQREIVDEEQPYVFLHPYLHTPYSEIRPIREAYWDKAFKATGIPYRRLKDARSTFATTLIRKGMGIGAVSEQLGHSSVLVTEKHYKAVIDAKTAEQRRIDLDAAFEKFWVEIGPIVIQPAEAEA